MSKSTRKTIISMLDTFAERNGEWTYLDEKLSHLEDLSNKELITEAHVKIGQTREFPKGLESVYAYVGNYVKSPAFVMSKEDRYIISILLSYDSPKDLNKKV